MDGGIGLSLNVIVAIALGYSAHKYGKNPIVWGLLGLVLGILAVGIFLIKIDKKVWGWIIVTLSILFYLIIIIAIIAMIFFIGFSL